MYKRKRWGVLGSAMILMGMLLAPSSASATAPNFCKGHLSRGAARGAAVNLQSGESAISFKFACAFPVTGFAIRTNNEVAGFDVALPVFDRANTLIPGESFACEGDTPGFGIGCNGVYTGDFHIIQGTLLTTAEPCKAPRAEADLVVAAATINKKGTIDQSITSPIKLGRVHGCPKVARHGKAGKKKRKVVA